jgi:hypothetical protein
VKSVHERYRSNLIHTSRSSPGKIPSISPTKQRALKNESKRNRTYSECRDYFRNHQFTTDLHCCSGHGQNRRTFIQAKGVDVDTKYGHVDINTRYMDASEGGDGGEGASQGWLCRLRYKVWMRIYEIQRISARSQCMSKKYDILRY